MNYARALCGRDHAVAFYDDPHDKWRLVSTHLTEAIDQGSGAIYVCYFENPDDVRENLKRHGVDTDLHEKKGNLRILELGDYIREQSYDKISSELSKVSDQLSAKGGFIREADDLTPAIRNGYAEEVLQFERLAGRALKWPIAAICAYESNAIIGQGCEFFKELMKAHGHAIFRGVAERLE